MTNNLPLADVKILDFMWVMAGPAGSRILADYGATIVRIESPGRVDTARTLQPFFRGKPEPDNSALFQNVNAGKYGISLDLGKEAGRAVAHDLVRWADVVTESFSPKAMRAWGLDYESLRKIKPDLIMLSTCLMGQSGPHARFAGFGNLAAAITGFGNVTGWPDRVPAGPFGAYTDYVSPRLTALAILAALDHHRRTGEGQYIDQSQGEASLHYLTPALLDYTANGHVQERRGNRDPQMAPHGVYATAGTDQWVAITATNEAQWQTLCLIIGRSDLLEDKRFGTLSDRLAHQDELDAEITAWTRQHEPLKIEDKLQAAGVPANAVPSLLQLYDDPQLHHRGHFVEVEHATLGKITVEGPRAKLSRTPAQVRRAAPTLGQDNQHVLENILGYSEERITELVIAEALSS